MHSSSTLSPSIALPKPWPQLGHIIDTLSLVLATLAGVAMLGTAGITVYEIVSRYFFNSPTYWTLEVSVYVLIWFGFASLAYVQRSAKHIRVDLLLQNLDDHARQLWDVVGLSISLLFAIIFIYFGYDFFYEAWHSGETSPDMLSAPVWIPKLALLLGPSILGIQLIKDLLSTITGIVRTKIKTGSGLKNAQIFPVLVFLVFLFFSWKLLYFVPIAGMIAFLLLLLFGGVPIYASLGLTGMAGVAAVYGGFNALDTIPNMAYGGINNFGLASLPLFILAGQILERSGVGKELYDMCAKFLGNLPGGLAGATILACAIFSAISIASTATAATIGLIALPELARRNYDKKFSYGVLAAGGTLGLMIPPSGTMIIYAAITEESLGKLFMAGLVPGIMLSGMFMVYAIFYCKRTGRYDKMETLTWQDKFQGLKNGIWGLLAPVTILVGIYTGIFTPLEAAGVVVIYSFLMSLIRGKLKFNDVVHVLRECTVTSGMLLIIISTAVVLGTFMTMLQIPTATTQMIQSSGMPGWTVIICLMILFLVLGMFLDVVSVMLITLPVVYPLVISMGYSGIWFAVLVTISMEIAVITPPVGLNLYVINGLTGAPLAHVLKGVLPFFLIMLAALLIIALFPGLSTWLPDMMFS